MLNAQATDALVRAVLDDHTIAVRKSAAAQPLYEYLFHRLWVPVLTACDHLVVTCSSHEHPRMGHTKEDDSSTAYLDECRAAVDQLSAAEVQAAQVCPAFSLLLQIYSVRSCKIEGQVIPRVPLQSAYSLVHAASKAAGQSMLAHWFLQKLNGKVGASFTGEASRNLDALNLAVTGSR